MVGDMVPIPNEIVFSACCRERRVGRGRAIGRFTLMPDGEDLDDEEDEVEEAVEEEGLDPEDWSGGWPCGVPFRRAA